MFLPPEREREPPRGDMSAEAGRRQVEQRTGLSKRLLLFARVVLLALLTVLGYLFRSSLAHAFDAALGIGWPFLWLFPLFLAWSLAAVLAWRKLLLATPRDWTPSTLRLLAIRIEGLAINLVVPASGLGGDVWRSTLTATDRGQKSSAPPVVLDRVAATVAEVLSAIVGLAFFVATATAVPWQIVLSIGSALFVTGVLYWWRGLFSLVGRAPWLRRSKPLKAIIQALVSNSRYRTALPKAVGWHLVERVLMIVEIWLIAAALGHPIGPGEATFVTALTTVFSFALFFMPAQLGGFEGGMAYGFVLLGMEPATGLGVALVRRGRQLVSSALGFLLLLLYERHRKP